MAASGNRGQDHDLLEYLRDPIQPSGDWSARPELRLRSRRRVTRRGLLVRGGDRVAAEAALQQVEALFGVLDEDREEVAAGLVVLVGSGLGEEPVGYRPDHPD